ncbi:hypothetical protein C8R45DRAFT_1159368, partial [Mycena sanguinolenta]
YADDASQIISGTDIDQPSTFIDQLADAAGCARDLPFLQQLGVNAIRAYLVDSTLNHDSCMSALSEWGGDLCYIGPDTPAQRLNRHDPPDVEHEFVGPAAKQSTSSPNTTMSSRKMLETRSSPRARPMPRYQGRPTRCQGLPVHHLSLFFHSPPPFPSPLPLASSRIVRAPRSPPSRLWGHLILTRGALVGCADIDGVSAFRDAVSDYLSCDPSGQVGARVSISVG